MIRGIFFSQLQRENIGPKQKVIAQVMAFEKAGFDMQLVEDPFVSDGFFRGNFFLRQIISRLPFTYIYSKHTWKPEYADADFYYIRAMIGDWYFTKFLKQLRQNNPKALILLEFADFPANYFMKTSFFSKIIYFPDLIKDYLSNRQYHKYVDRIVLLQNKNEAHGIPVIKMINGVDMSGIRVKKAVGTDKIRMIAVASMKPFHGYERIIEGMHLYRQHGGKELFELHLVGGSDDEISELTRYKELVRKFHLEDAVCFYGVKTGADLDEIVDKCNIAVASLSLYRYNIMGKASSLKTREYLGKGLPIISGNEIDILGDNFAYVLCVGNVDNPIDMDIVADFFHNIYSDGEEKVIQIIRKFAEDTCDVTVTMKPVTDFILHHMRMDESE